MSPAPRKKKDEEAPTAAEVEARIDRLSSPLQSQIMAYHRQRDQGC